MLKDGTTPEDARLGRLIQFDEKSKEFSIRTLVAEKPLRSYTWGLTTRLDQGPDGACVGFAFAHELAASPKRVRNIDYDSAMSIYWGAQLRDPWRGGAYPDAAVKMDGTSVLAAAKNLQKTGLFSEYRWAFSRDDALKAVGHEGPGILGIWWYEGMMETDEKGFVHPTGQKVGGHAILVRGVNFRTKTVRLSNSWGTSWGKDGDCFLTFDDFEKLLMDEGEFCIPMGRSS